MYFTASSMGMIPVILKKAACRTVFVLDPRPSWKAISTALMV